MIKKRREIGAAPKYNIFTAVPVPILHRELRSKYKESRRELKINAFLCDSLRQFSFSSAVSVFLDSSNYETGYLITRFRRNENPFKL